MPSTTSSWVSRPLASSTVMTPSLPTLLIASAMISPMVESFFTYPRELSEILRNWLEFYPDKVLFGTDAFAFGPEVDWGEVAWLSNTTARQALALALTGMMNDGEIDRARALES